MAFLCITSVGWSYLGPGVVNTLNVLFCSGMKITMAQIMRHFLREFPFFPANLFKSDIARMGRMPDSRTTTETCWDSKGPSRNAATSAIKQVLHPHVWLECTVSSSNVKFDIICFSRFVCFAPVCRGLLPVLPWYLVFLPRSEAMSSFVCLPFYYPQISALPRKCLCVLCAVCYVMWGMSSTS